VEVTAKFQMISRMFGMGFVAVNPFIAWLEYHSRSGAT
jgi:hypothetical protein